VCTPEEMIGSVCDLELELVVASSDDAVIASAGESGQEISTAAAADEGEATGVNEPESSNGETGEGATVDQATNPAGDAFTAIGKGSSANEVEPLNTDNDLKMIIPVAVGCSLVALGLAGFLYLRFKRKNEHGREVNGNKVNDTMESEDKMAPELHLLPPAIWADSAYDDITSPSNAKTATAVVTDSTVFGTLKNSETAYDKQ